MGDRHLGNIFLLSLATVFISTSGALGKFIELPSAVLVWWRAALAAILLYIFCRIRKVSLKIERRDTLAFLTSAIFMGAHWLTYFLALKYSNVALGMLSLFTYPVITVLLEPLFFRNKLNKAHIFLGIIVLGGVYLLVPEFNLKNTHLIGILFGLLSALCFSLRTIILKKIVSDYNSSMLMFYQLLLVSIMFTPLLFFFNTGGWQGQFGYILLLAFVTTALGHTLFVQALRNFSASSAGLIASAQPVYGILIAWFFLSEIPVYNTIIGGALILLTVVIESARSRKTER